MNPLVSIIVPVYKVEKYIRRCIDSILSQTYQDFELIIIDDGSPDHSGKICDEYAKKDRRIHVIHQENQGISAARNTGIKKSCGEYLCFVDSDDYVNVHLLSTVIPQMTEKNADAAIFNAQVVYGRVYGKILGWNIQSNQVESSQIKQYLLQGYDSYVWKKIYKRIIWKDIVFPIGKKYEDLYVIAHLVQNISNIIAIPNILYYYECEDHGSITQNRNIRSLFDACEAWITNMNYVDDRMKEWYYLNAVCIFIECVIKFNKHDDFYEEFNVDNKDELSLKYKKILEINMNQYKVFAYRFIQYRISVLQYDLFSGLQIEDSTYWRNKLSLHIIRNAIRVYCINYIQNILNSEDINDLLYQLHYRSKYRKEVSLGRRFMWVCIKNKYNIFLYYEGNRLLNRKI